MKYNHELEALVLKSFKNIRLVKSNEYSVTVQNVKDNKIYVIMKSYLMKVS